MRLDRIRIVEYDVRWPALFEEQRHRVGKAPFITSVLEKLAH